MTTLPPEGFKSEKQETRALLKGRRSDAGSGVLGCGACVSSMDSSALKVEMVSMWGSPPSTGHRMTLRKRARVYRNELRPAVDLA